MTKKDRIQYLLITYLMREGQIKLALPDGMNISLGLTKETKHGQEICPDYCWATLSQDDKEISLDQFNLGLKFSKKRMILQNNEEEACTVEVV